MVGHNILDFGEALLDLPLFPNCYDIILIQNDEIVSGAIGFFDSELMRLKLIYSSCYISIFEYFSLIFQGFLVSEILIIDEVVLHLVVLIP